MESKSGIDNDQSDDFEIELPAPDDFQGWIYKRSRYLKQFRKRYCVISIKYAVMFVVQFLYNMQY